MHAVDGRRLSLYLLAPAGEPGETAPSLATLTSKLARVGVHTGVCSGLSCWQYVCELPPGADEEAERLDLLRAVLPTFRHSPYFLYFPRTDAVPVERWAFDLDGTLLPEEILPLLAKEYGCVEAMTRMTDEAMSGLVAFGTSFRERTELLRGLPQQAFAKLARELVFPAGTLRLLDELRQAGYPRALVSGNYRPLVETLARRLHIPYYIGSAISVDQDGRLLGLAGEGLVGEAEKREFIGSWGDPLSTSYVGDGANDLSALALAGHAFLVGSELVRTQGLACLSSLPNLLSPHTPSAR